MNITMIHPMLVHFPIALILVGFLFASLAVFCPKCNAVGSCKSNTSSDGGASKGVSCIQKVAFWLLGLGAISAIAALTSGHLFTTAMPGVLGQLRDTHASFALASMVVALIAAAIYAYYIYSPKRVAQVQWIGYALYIVAAAMIGFTGHLGGQLVFGF